MAAAIYFVTDNPLSFPTSWKWIIFLALMIAEFLFAWLTQISLFSSCKISNEIEKALWVDRSKYRLDIPNLVKNAYCEVFKDWKGDLWIIFQLLITAGIGLILMFMI